MEGLKLKKLILALTLLFGFTCNLKAEIGDPLPGLTQSQLNGFFDGKDDFEEEETAATGLGPIFNRSSCAECHGFPAIGGSSNITVTRFGRTKSGAFDSLANLGGSLLQERAIVKSGLETVPHEANVRAKRQSTPLFGLGLVEAIPDATILRGVRTTPVDGIFGKASIVDDVSTKTKLVGKFGWKAQHARLLSFAGDAYLNEMGITNRLFPKENAPNGNIVLLTKLDKVADPEDDGNGIDILADFMRYLAPPPTNPTTANTAFGAKLFFDIGCAKCHTPVMTTSSKIKSLDKKNVWLYSDLLLHDMGKLGDGIVQGMAGPKDIKTAPLWGIKDSGPYLHDGSAKTIDAAIRDHDGEAKIVIDRYKKLKVDQRKLIIEFLNSI